MFLFTILQQFLSSTCEPALIIIFILLSCPQVKAHLRLEMPAASQNAVVVPLQVQRQVVRPGERPLTHPALERPVPRVLPHVPRQLVGAGKLPAAVLPRADVGLLASVRPEMRLEVRRLGVALAAAGVLAGVRGQLPLEAVQLGLGLMGHFGIQVMTFLLVSQQTYLTYLVGEKVSSTVLS